MEKKNKIKTNEIPKERKWILIFGAIVLLLGAVYRFYPALSTLVDSTKEIQFRTAKIAKLNQIVSKRNDLELLKNQLNKKIIHANEILFEGETPAICAGQIQSIVKKIALDKKAEIKSTKILKTEKMANAQYSGISIRFQLQGMMSQVRDIIYGIESFDKTLTITKISIRVPNKDKWENVTAEITLMGLMHNKNAV